MRAILFVVLMAVRVTCWNAGRDDGLMDDPHAAGWSGSFVDFEDPEEAAR